tara:strand:- start:1195 stop:1593 length:399 start_codon:yes stop_codon:yes gene_type:complete
MLTNFENYTSELTPEERKMVPTIVNGLKQLIGKEKAWSNKRIGQAILDRYNVKLSSPRLRKIIQYIRVKDLVPCLIATSIGYYVAANKKEVEEYIKSLEERINSISLTKYSIERQFNNKYIKPSNNQINLGL